MNYQKAIQQQLPIEKLGSGDCSVKCVSIVCDVPYMVAHKALSKQCRKTGKGATYRQIKGAINRLGFGFRQVDVQAKTMATLERDFTVSSGYYFALVRGHIASVVNGKIEDWTEGRRHKIIEVCRVEPSVSRKERKQRIKQIMGA